MKQSVTRISTLSALGFAAVLTMPLLLGCDSMFGSGDCTLIGCDSGVEVRFSGPVPAVFEIGLTPAGGDERVISCEHAVAGWCVDGVFFENVTATEAVLHVRWEEGSITQAVQLEYERFQPNGPRCGPLCLLSKAEVEF
jgi:hypothetical protein